MARRSSLLPVGIFYGLEVYFWAIWYIFGLFGIFLGYLVYFWAIWYIFGLFGIFLGYLVYFSRFGMLRQEKSGNPVKHFKETNLSEKRLHAQISSIEGTLLFLLERSKKPNFDMT
jgi:hypothetical protein